MLKETYPALSLIAKNRDTRLIGYLENHNASTYSNPIFSWAIHDRELESIEHILDYLWAIKIGWEEEDKMVWGKESWFSSEELLQGIEKRREEAFATAN